MSTSENGTAIESKRTTSTATADHGSVDAHDCQLEPTGRGSGMDEEFRCTTCGVTTTPRKGLKRAKSQRKR